MATLLAAFALSFAVKAATVDGAGAARVVTYRCDGGRYLAVGYPAGDDTRAPVRISWQGRTVELSPIRRLGTGRRFSNPMADLEWWSQGGRGALTRVHNNRPLLNNCVEF